VRAYYDIYPNVLDGGKTYGLLLRGGSLICRVYGTDNGGRFQGFFSRSTAYRIGKQWVQS